MNLKQRNCQTYCDPSAELQEQWKGLTGIKEMLTPLHVDNVSDFMIFCIRNFHRPSTRNFALDSDSVQNISVGEKSTSGTFITGVCYRSTSQPG